MLQLECSEQVCVYLAPNQVVLSSHIFVDGVRISVVMFDASFSIRKAVAVAEEELGGEVSVGYVSILVLLSLVVMVLVRSWRRFTWSVVSVMVVVPFLCEVRGVCCCC